MIYALCVVYGIIAGIVAVGLHWDCTGWTFSRSLLALFWPVLIAGGIIKWGGYRLGLVK